MIKRMTLAVTVLCTLLLSLNLSSPTHAQTGTIDFVGQIGGSTNAVFVDGNTAYIGVGPRLVILDISNPANPTKLGQSPVLPDIVQDVYVSGSYAYVANHDEGGLQIINISNPANPILIGSYDTPSSALGVTVSGSYAYVADTAGLQIINISNPANPFLSGSYNTSGFAYEVTVSGSYAYVADTAGLQIINISNPANPTLTSSYDTFPYEVAVSGSYAYVAASSGLQIINISSPANPTLTASYDTPARGVAVSGSYAYVANGSGLQIINISNPANPSLTGSTDTPGWVAVSGSYAYVAASSGLQIINISSPTNPILSGSYNNNTFVSARGVAVSGSYAYVAASSGLQIINISNPANPSLTGSTDTPGGANGVAVSGNYAYVADRDSGLQIINISNPANPTLTGNYDTPGDARGVAVSGSYAYVADGYSGLQIINISNPTNPTLTGSYDTPGVANGVAVSGNYAYVADSENSYLSQIFDNGGLQVVDISNPANPILSGSYNNDTPSSAYEVAVSGNYAYVAAGYRGLQIINISNLANPSLTASYDTPNYARGVAVSGSYAYVADRDSGLQIINISNPANPSLTASTDTPGSAYGVAVSDSLAYVADVNGGLMVLRFNDSPPTPTPTNTPTSTPTNTPTSTPTATPAVADLDLSKEANVSQAQVGETIVYTFRFTNTGNTHLTDVTLTDDKLGSGPLLTLANFAPGQVEQTTASYVVQQSDLPGPLVNTANVVGQASFGTTNGSDLAVVSIREAATETPTYTPTPSKTPTPQPTNTSTLQSVNTATNTPTPQPTSSSPTNTPQSVNTATNTPQPTATPTNTPTPQPTSSSPTSTPQSVNTATNTPQPTATPTDTPTPQPTSSSPTNTPQPTNPPSTPMPTVDPTTYEPNDSCAQAKPINPDGVAQIQRFETPDDEDWLYFDGLAGTEYLIEVRIPPTSTVDSLVEMWDDCNQQGNFPDTPLVPDFRMTFTAPDSRQYYLKVSDDGPTGGDKRYHISVRSLQDSLPSGAVIIVAGKRRDDDPLQANIHGVTNTLYQLAQEQGCSPDQIYYLATDTTMPGVSGRSTSNQLRHAITEWATDKVNANYPLTVFMMDHGANDKLYLDGPGEVVTPLDLAAWFDQLEGQIPALKTNLIIEACNSGSWILPQQSVAKTGRVIVTSTGQDLDAYATDEGASFSDAFLSGLRQGMSLQTAFEEGQWAVSQATQQRAFQQTPWLDDNGNSEPNDSNEGRIAAKRIFGCQTTSPTEAYPPHITQAELQNLANNQGEFQVQVETNSGTLIDRVWVVIYTPSANPDSNNDEDMVAEPASLGLFRRSDGSYGSQYNFAENGQHRVVVYAESRAGLRSRPYEFTVTVGESNKPIYLPVVIK